MTYPSQQDLQDNSTVLVTLSEHDAYQLLKLVKKEISRCDLSQQPYWEQLAQAIEAGMGQARS